MKDFIEDLIGAICIMMIFIGALYAPLFFG